MLTAQESGDPRALAQTAWFALEIHHDADDCDTAEVLHLGRPVSAARCLHRQAT
jgi:hypothetical protein